MVCRLMCFYVVFFYVTGTKTSQLQGKLWLKAEQLLIDAVPGGMCCRLHVPASVLGHLVEKFRCKIAWGGI